MTIELLKLDKPDNFFSGRPANSAHFALLRRPAVGAVTTTLFIPPPCGESPQPAPPQAGLRGVAFCSQSLLGAADRNVIIGKKHGNVPVASIPVENIAMLRKFKPGDRIAFAIFGAVAYLLCAIPITLLIKNLMQFTAPTAGIFDYPRNNN